MVYVKVCGITNKDDALKAAELGVSALGFIFAPSPRRIVPEIAGQIIRVLPPFMKTVGVFVDEELSTVREVMDRCGIDLAQLHGRESPAYCGELMPRAVKAFRVKDASSLAPMEDYRGRIRGVLLDAYVSGAAGGTSKTFDWGLARKARGLGIPVTLAGGLGPENIEEAVAAAGPHAVDINSGIERCPGKKDHDLMAQFMEKVRGLNMKSHIHGESPTCDRASSKGLRVPRVKCER